MYFFIYKIRFVISILFLLNVTIYAQEEINNEQKIKRQIAIDLVYPNYTAIVATIPEKSLILGNGIGRGVTIDYLESRPSFGMYYSFEANIGGSKLFYFNPEIGFSILRGYLKVRDIVGTIGFDGLLEEDQSEFNFDLLNYVSGFYFNLKPKMLSGFSIGFGPRLSVKLFELGKGTVQKNEVDYSQTPFFIEPQYDFEYMNNFELFPLQANLRFYISKDFTIQNRVLTFGLNYEYPFVYLHEKSGFRSSPINLSIKYGKAFTKPEE